MNNFRISIQNSKIVAFEGSKEIGTTTMEQIQDFCKNNNIDFPLICNERNQECINIVQEYFSK